MKSLFLKLRKRWLIVLGALVGVVLVGLPLALWLGARYVTAAVIVEEVEDSLNCRLEIAELELKAFRVPSTVVLRGVKVGERDRWVKRPLGERPKIERADVEVEEVRLAVSALALLTRTIDVRELALVRPQVRMVWEEDGSSNLMERFRSSPDREKKRKKQGKSSMGALNVDEIGMLARVKGVRLSDGQAKILVKKTGLKIEVKGLSAELDEIEVNPAALEETNEARLSLSGRFLFGWEEGGPEQAGLVDLEGEAVARLFDPETADLNPDVKGDFLLGDESFVSMSLPPISRMLVILGKVADFGMSLGGMPKHAEFGRGNTVGLHYVEQKVTALEPLSLWFGDWELALLGGSWLDLASEEHDIRSEVVASQGMSDLMHSGLEKGLGHLPRNVRPHVMEELDAQWFVDGRFVSRLRSHGTLSDPDLDLENPFPDLEELAKEALKELGRSLLEGIFD